MPRFTILVLLAVLAIAAPASASSSREDAGFWTFLFAQGDFTPAEEEPGPWRWAIDVQARFLDEANGFNQSLLRPVVGHTLPGGFTGWLGYAWIRTEPPRGGKVDEQRIFQQLTWSGDTGPFATLLRTRLEQRLIEGADDAAWRFRQFVKLGIPLGLGRDLRAVAYDEIFFNLNDPEDGPRSGVDQNRLFVGLAIPIGGAAKSTFEIGYLNQWVRVPGGTDPVNHILSLNLFFDFR